MLAEPIAKILSEYKFELLLGVIFLAIGSCKSNVLCSDFCAAMETLP
jgi:hypothetical protein